MKKKILSSPLESVAIWWLGTDEEARMGEVHLPSTRADACEGTFTPQAYTLLSQNLSSRGKDGLAMSVLSGYAGRGVRLGI